MVQLDAKWLIVQLPRWLLSAACQAPKSVGSAASTVAALTLNSLDASEDDMSTDEIDVDIAANTGTVVATVVHQPGYVIESFH